MATRMCLAAIVMLVLTACAAAPENGSQTATATTQPSNPTREALEPPASRPQPTAVADVIPSALPVWVADAAGLSEAAPYRQLDPAGGTFSVVVADSSLTVEANTITFQYGFVEDGDLMLNYDKGLLKYDPNMLSEEISLFQWAPSMDDVFVPLMATYTGPEGSFVLVDGVNVTFGN